MSSAKYATPLRLELRSSRRFAAWLMFAYGGAAIIAWLLPLAVWLSLALSMAVLASGFQVFGSRILMRGDQAVTGLIWKGNGEWTLLMRSGARQECRLLPGSYVHPRLTVLRLAGDRSRSIVLLPDSLDHETFRRLRVRLKLEGAEKTGTDRDF